MSSRKGKVAGDTEEKVAGDRESNREEKMGKKTERIEFYMLWKEGKKRESNKENKMGKKVEKK